jgi:hypothetical protein
MWAQGIQRLIDKNRDVVQGVFLRKYPAFVWCDRVDELDGVHTFVFHDVTTESLEPILQFLADNRYVTLTSDEYVERQIYGERGQEREVMLTFDDGHKSLYEVAYPALKRFKLNAVAYIVPGEVPESDGASTPELWAKSLCNWKEIVEMHNSGGLDFQSHSMYHHSIPLSDRVVDFVRTATQIPWLEPYMAVPFEAEGKVKKSYGYAYGTPIYEGGARYGDALAALSMWTAMVEKCISENHAGDCV